MTASGCEVDEVTFVEDPLDINHECLVCLQLLREPWIVECCGHHLCKPCIDKLIRDGKGCPHCRTSRFRHMRDRNHERILLGKQVYCKYKRRGCKWQGKLKEFDRHCATILNCKWCRKRLQCYEQEQHEKVCTVAVEVIACELKPFGCRQKLPRMNMSQHMQDYCNEHVRLLKEANMQSSSEVNRLTNKVNLLEKDQVDMQIKYQTLSTTFNQTRMEVNNLRKEKAQHLRVQHKICAKIFDYMHTWATDWNLPTVSLSRDLWQLCTASCSFEHISLRH